MNWVVLLIGLPIAIVLGVVLWESVAPNFSRRRWLTTEAKIDAWSVAPSGSDENQAYWAVHLTHSYSVAGAMHTAQRVGTVLANDATWWERLSGAVDGYTRQAAEREAERRFARGTSITVRYDPRAPEDSRPMLD